MRLGGSLALPALLGGSLALPALESPHVKTTLAGPDIGLDSLLPLA
jgi:hypothetical protein